MPALHDADMTHAPGPLQVVADTVGEDAVLGVAPEHGVFTTFTITGGMNPVAILPNNPRRKVAYIFTIGSTFTETVLIGSQQQVGSGKAGGQLPVTGMKVEVDSQEQYWAGPTDTNTANSSMIMVADFWYESARVSKAVKGVFATDGAI